MVTVSVGSVLDRAAFYLNDVNRDYFSNTVLMEPFIAAYDDLKEQLFEVNMAAVMKKSEALEITAETVLDVGGPTGPALPRDFVAPIELWEKSQDTSNDYVEMKRLRVLPNTDVKTVSLVYWAYHNQYIHFLGATSNRTVKMYYISDTLEIPDDVAARINLFNAKSYLAYRTAALAADYLGENAERADKLNNEADKAMEVLLNTDTKNQQSMPVRRRPFVTRNSRTYW